MIEKAYAGEQKRTAQLSDAFALVLLGKTETGALTPLQFLIDSLNSASWRGVARAFLVELGRDAAVRRSLEQALRQGNKSEKIELAQVLSISGDKETVACLDALSHDSNPEVAQAGLNASRSLKARLP